MKKLSKQPVVALATSEHYFRTASVKTRKPSEVWMWFIDSNSWNWTSIRKSSFTGRDLRWLYIAWQRGLGMSHRKPKPRLLCYLRQQKALLTLNYCIVIRKRELIIIINLSRFSRRKAQSYNGYKSTVQYSYMKTIINTRRFWIFFFFASVLSGFVADFHVRILSCLRGEG